MIGVLVAGIGGASLGTEIVKCLRRAGGYRIVGCDISALAFGHYDGSLDASALVSRERYIDDLLALCQKHEVRVIIPGGDQPARLIAAEAHRFDPKIVIAANAPELVAQLSDKARCFELLHRLGFKVPQTIELSNDNLDAVALPCIIKPSLESGGSAYVFYARNADEVQLYAGFLLRNGLRPIAQEYIPHDGGEFTVGALSGMDGCFLGTIALKRSLSARLSVAIRGDDFLISSGYSQGHIAAYETICSTVRAIAEALGSRGPLNIQGRIDARGCFLPFEINPRFSASTYLRTMAGFNEVDHFIKRSLGLEPAEPLSITPGWYLRSLTEIAVREEDILR
jgi:carbamoyl-phosphate synthase large subunit